MPQFPKPMNTEGNNEKLEESTWLPTGRYIVAITKSEYKENKKKTGHYMQMDLTVVEDEYRGKSLLIFLNLDNPNPLAVEMATKVLNTICSVCDKTGVESSEELHNVPFVVDVILDEGDGSSKQNNEVVAYMSTEQAKSAPAMPGTSPPANNVVELPVPTPKPPLEQTVAVNVEQVPNQAAASEPAKLPWE